MERPRKKSKSNQVTTKYFVLSLKWYCSQTFYLRRLHGMCACEWVWDRKVNCTVLCKEYKRVQYTIAQRNKELSSMWCVAFIASSFGSDITHNISAGSALKSPAAGALRNPRLASHFQTIKCRAGFPPRRWGIGTIFSLVSPICLQCYTEFSQLSSDGDVIVQQR